MGYKTYKLIPLTQKSDINKMPSGPNWMENEFFQIYFGRNGTFDIKDKQYDNLFVGLHHIEDSGDIGHAWGYKPPKNNSVITSLKAKAKISRIHHSKNIVVSAVKEACSSSNIVVRLFNPSTRKVATTLRPSLKLKKARLVEMLDGPVKDGPLSVEKDGHQIPITIPAKKVFSIELIA